MVTLTSLFTPVKIDGYPSGQTCEQEERGKRKGGGGGQGEEGGERECDKASNKLAKTPVHARHTHSHFMSKLHRHSNIRGMNKATVTQCGISQMTNNDTPRIKE